MTYASIMVAMDLTPEARDRARLAACLAESFDARLIGVAADQPAYAIPPVGPTPASVYALAASDESVLDDLRRAHGAFEEAVEARSRVSWRSNLDFPLSFRLPDGYLYRVSPLLANRLTDRPVVDKVVPVP